MLLFVNTDARQPFLNTLSWNFYPLTNPFRRNTKKLRGLGDVLTPPHRTPLCRKSNTVVSILCVFLRIYAINIVWTVYRGLFLTCLVEVKIIISYDCIITPKILDKLVSYWETQPILCGFFWLNYSFSLKLCSALQGYWYVWNFFSVTLCESQNGTLKSYFDSRFSLFRNIWVGCFWFGFFFFICPRQVF